MGDLAPRATVLPPDLPETSAFTAMADRLGTTARHFAAMADRLLPKSVPSIGHGGKVPVLLRIWRVFMGGAPFERVVKHTTLGTSAPHFAAMAVRLLSQSVPSASHGGEVGVLPRIWHAFTGGSPFARAVKHVALDTSAPRFAAMADRLLPQGAPSAQLRPAHASPGQPRPAQTSPGQFSPAQASSGQPRTAQASPDQPSPGQASFHEAKLLCL